MFFVRILNCNLISKAYETHLKPWKTTNITNMKFYENGTLNILLFIEKCTFYVFIANYSDLKQTFTANVNFFLKKISL